MAALFGFSIPSLDWKDGGYKGHEHRLEVRSSALFCLDGEKRWCGFIVWIRQNDIFYILLYFLLHLRSECCAEGAMSVVIGKV